MRASAHASWLNNNIRIGRMAEDSKDESVATDDDSDYTGADGSHSLNNVVRGGFVLLLNFTCYLIKKTTAKLRYKNVCLP